ncbi:MAG: hypothetical protein ACI4JJ_06810 [Huintestinicola sp.]
MNLRLQALYPGYIFRAVADCKNIAPRDDMWSEGSLFRDDHGNLLIINRKKGDGVYSQDYIRPDTLGMSSGFTCCDGREIFEGDIVRIRRFTKTESLGGFPTADSVLDSMGINDEEYESEPLRGSDGRIIHSEIPTGYEAAFKVKGVVFLQNGMFYIQYFDKNLNMLTCMPLYIFFGYDALPGDDVVAEVIGNIYDNTELYEKVLHITHSEAVS